MNLEAFREEFASYQRKTDEDARAFKDSHLATERLFAEYRRFDVEERSMADQILTEWALSEEEALRFDAIALIEDAKIVIAASALKKLASRLATSDAAGAPFELEKVHRVLKELERDAREGQRP